MSLEDSHFCNGWLGDVVYGDTFEVVFVFSSSLDSRYYIRAFYVLHNVPARLGQSPFLRVPRTLSPNKPILG